MERLQNKIAIITGGGHGIGQATCRLFAREGAAVVIADCDAPAGLAVAQAIQAESGRAMFLPTDVADEGSVVRMVAAAEQAHGRIDMLVNNAAVFVLKGLDATVEQWRRSNDINILGPALVAKHTAPLMLRAGRGCIVNLASISSFIAQPEHLVYNASKAAVAEMTRCMAMDLAPTIRVNAVAPGNVWTRIVEQRAGEQGLLNRAAADAHPGWGGNALLKRIADPMEIAQAILFLASDDASFITGEVLMVDGGYTAK